MRRLGERAVSNAKYMVTREIGMALAVLSIWLMSLLAPMHQVSRLIGELSQAGIITVSHWSLCVPLDLDGDGPDGPVTLCPAQGIGKSDMLVPMPAVLLAVAVPAVLLDGFDLTPERFWSRFQSEPGQPRAPPIHS